MNPLWSHLVGVSILVLMLTFLGIWIWAWRPRHRRTFDALAHLPMEDSTAQDPVTRDLGGADRQRSASGDAP